MNFVGREYVVPPGMPKSVFENKYARKKPGGSYQTWAERVVEVVGGNFALDPRSTDEIMPSYLRTVDLAVAGVFATSGRHLQHGDHRQPNLPMELHSNCSTAMFSFMLFRLLLRGSGVGRDYSAATCRVDWSNMPDVRLVLSEEHPDYRPELFRGALEPLRDAKHKYDSESERVRWFVVQDSREGWAKVVEILETAAFHQIHSGKLFVFDFSEVRAAGQPIRGLQNRPASGPLPLMHAISRLASIKAAGMKPWKQALYADHYLAECVVMGGARRAARMATKSWRDRDAIEFVDIKRGGYLWSANNSLLVDAEFWEAARKPQHSHARRVFEAATNAAFWDHTGEPGFINVDLMNGNLDGLETITGANCISRDAYPDLHDRTVDMIDNVLSHVKRLKHPFVTNPCGEIPLSIWGGYCLIGDVNLAQARSVEEASDAVGLMSWFLIRCNRMKCDYRGETDRTNRIGVALTGVHEFAWTNFNLTFRELIDYDHTDTHVAHAFWSTINQLRLEAEGEAYAAAATFEMTVPHTVTTVKPSGTVSKVLNCSEGVHLPALSHYLRWVQYKSGDPALTDLAARGYPVKDISHRYADHVAVGFPTRQPIVQMMGKAVTTADETTPAENFTWLRLLDTYWLGGARRNNNISYTLKYDAGKVGYHEFMDLILEHQPHVRCCSVMPQSDWRESEKIYAYVPEQPLSQEEYESIVAGIAAPIEREAYDDSEFCAAEVCPIEPDR